MSKFSQKSFSLRQALAYACRILAANGHNDTVLGHVSYREPEANTFWMKPSEMGLDEVTPETLIRVDLDGKVIEGELPLHLEFPIHSEIFRARPEITCVVHTHPMHSIAFGALEQPLRPLSHEGAQFSPPDVPRFTLTSNLIKTPELGKQVQNCLGGAPACLLKNHGIVTAANTIEGAVIAAINLERACQIQLLAAACGNYSWSCDEEALAKQQTHFGTKQLQNLWKYHCRKVDSITNPSFKDWES